MFGHETHCSRTTVLSRRGWENCFSGTPFQSSDSLSANSCMTSIQCLLCITNLAVLFDTSEVEGMVQWCESHNLMLNVSETKEIILILDVKEIIVWS